MHSRPLNAITLLVLGFALGAPGFALAAPVETTADNATEIAMFGLRRPHFVSNAGQWSDASIHYGLQAPGLDLAFRNSAITMHLARQVGNEANASRGKGPAPPRIDDVRGDSSTFDAHQTRGDEDSAPAWEQLTLTVTFPGSNPVQPIGAQPQNAKFNYFVGGQGRSVATDVPSFGAIFYDNLYDGIDLHVTGGKAGGLKYEFHCAPGADYAQIRIHYDGIEMLAIDDAGDLRIETAMGSMRDAAPVAWQTSPAEPLATGFTQIDARTYAFEVRDEVDPAQPLIIDPEIEWMIYLGGSDADVALQVVIDPQGNSLVSGNSASTDFDGRMNSNSGGDWDSTALKVSPTGELLWMTYLGGSGDDRGRGITVDPQGRIFVSGLTSSLDFAGRVNSYIGGDYDTYMLELDSAGQLQWMKYFGGTGDDRGRVVTLTGQGAAMITGETSSTDFIGRINDYHGGEWDAFVLKVDLAGQVQWVSYFGGSDADLGYTMGIDAANDVFLCGYTWSPDFTGRNNTHHGNCDSFVLKYKPTGTLVWMTYCGGTADDESWSLAVDQRGDVVVAGRSASTDFAGRGNEYQGGPSCVAVLKINAAGLLQWMSYFGGTGEDGARNVVLDPRGHALVTGHSDSPDFEGAINPPAGGTNDGYLLRVDPWGDLAWMMYLGGSNLDFEFGIVMDGEDHVMVGGRSTSSDFVGRLNNHYGGLDATLTRVRLDRDDPHLAVLATCPSGGSISVTWADASPRGTVALLFARDMGAFVIPSQYPCAGTTLGLGVNQIQIAFQGDAGVDGSRRVGASTGPSACGGYFQLLDLTTCATSNVVRIE
ncbi:MAG: SBBP repeat-containing protein [Phycisphaerales bacterium]|nr:SBBP repeat-containing protein [Phycisphaerales bacterium]